MANEELSTLDSAHEQALEEAIALAAGGYNENDFDAYGRGRLDASRAIQNFLEKKHKGRHKNRNATIETQFIRNQDL